MVEESILMVEESILMVALIRLLQDLLTKHEAVVAEFLGSHYDQVTILF